MLTTVRDLLKAKGHAVWHVSPESTVLDALNLLAEKDIGALLVLENAMIAGIVSERDFVRKIAQKQACELKSHVKDYMTQEVFTIHPSQNIEDCMQMMTEKHIRHLPVTDGDEILGLISIGDVIKGIISSHEFTIEQLSKYIDGGAYNQ
jgi:CBS domain-containing protein